MLYSIVLIEQLFKMQASPNESQLCIFEYYNIERIEAHMYEEYFNNPNSFSIYRFAFDHVYDQDSTQEDVYITSAKPSVLSVLQVRTICLQFFQNKLQLP